MTPKQKEKSAQEIVSLLDKAKQQWQDLKDDVDEAVSNLTEKQTDSERGQKLLAQADALDEVYGQLEDAESGLNGIEW